MRCAPGGGGGRLRILFDGADPSGGSARHRSVRAGRIGGTRTGRGRGGGDEPTATEAVSGITTVAGADAVARGASLLWAAQGDGRAGVRGIKTATRDAPISAARPEGGGSGMGLGDNRLQPDPDVYEETIPAKLESG